MSKYKITTSKTIIPKQQITKLNTEYTKDNKKRHLRNSTMINVYKSNCNTNAIKKPSLNKKLIERKVKSQCTANRSPIIFQDITIEYIYIG